MTAHWLLPPFLTMTESMWTLKAQMLLPDQSMIMVPMPSMCMSMTTSDTMKVESLRIHLAPPTPTTMLLSMWVMTLWLDTGWFVTPGDTLGEKEAISRWLWVKMFVILKTMLGYLKFKIDQYKVHKTFHLLYHSVSIF